jgi:hypothetical protein
MVEFYVELLGLQVTDRDDELGIVFLSFRPETEHRELVLQAGRTAPAGTRLTHRISWRIDSLDTLVDFHHRFRQYGVRVQQEVTHGNAFGIYMLTKLAPEGTEVRVLEPGRATAV